MKKWMCLSLLVAVLVATGCQQNTGIVENNNNLVIKDEQLSEDLAGLVTVETFAVTPEEGGETESDEGRTFQEVLGQDIYKLTTAQIEELSIAYKEIETFEFAEDDSNEEVYYTLLDDFDLKMMDFGLDVPFYSYAEVVDKFEDDISASDRETLFELRDRKSVV